MCSRSNGSIRARTIEDLTDVYGTPSPEPEDCSRSTIKRIRKTGARLEYRFLTKWSEPHLLFRRVSRAYPRLHFLLGAVSPANDEANCWYFRDGRGRNWKMSDRQRTEIRRRVYRNEGLDIDVELDIDDDLELMLDVEGDHAMLSEVLARWTAVRRRVVRRSGATR